MHLRSSGPSGPDRAAARRSLTDPGLPRKIGGLDERSWANSCCRSAHRLLTAPGRIVRTQSIGMCSLRASS